MSKTIEEVARAVGVSVTTVRLVTAGHGDKYRISAGTQKLVMDYVGKHGYRINHAARALKLQRSDAIGLVIPEINNVFFARLMAELESLCRANGLVLLTASTQEDRELEQRALQTLLARGVDGLIVAASEKPAYQALLGSKPRTPIVLIDRAYDAAPYPAVTSDNRRGAVELSRALLKECGGPIAFLCAKPALPSIVARLAGFAEAWEETGRIGCEAAIYRADTDSVAAGGALVNRMLAATGLLPRGLLCSSLLVLEGAMQEIKSSRDGIPAELIVATFDDHAMLDFLPNRVLSMRQDVPALARRAFDLLHRQMSGEVLPPERQTVPVSIAYRN